MGPEKSTVGSRVACTLALLASLTAARPASAHALGAECRVVGARVEVQAFYDDDTPAGNARVAVRDADRKLVAEGHTDARGQWSFDRPAAGRYEVSVNAGAGHRKTVTITIPEGSTADAPPQPEVVSEGPTREEFTRTHWLNVGIGLGAIALFSLAFRWARRRGGRPNPP
jgi:hypothetical protein